MEKEKIVAVLLLATIALSVVSVLMIFDFDTEEIPISETQSPDSNSGNVQLVVEENPLKVGVEQ